MSSKCSPFYFVLNYLFVFRKHVSFLIQLPITISLFHHVMGLAIDWSVQLRILRSLVLSWRVLPLYLLGSMIIALHHLLLFPLTNGLCHLQFNLTKFSLTVTSLRKRWLFSDEMKHLIHALRNSNVNPQVIKNMAPFYSLVSFPLLPFILYFYLQFLSLSPHSPWRPTFLLCISILSGML